MGRIYPDKPLEGTRSNAERKVFYALKDLLPDDYTAFHSVPIYRQSDATGGLLDGEADFIIACPDKGLLIVEVKGGGISFDSSQGKWATINASHDLHEIKNPFEQAKRYKYALLDDLRRCRLTHSYSYPLGHAVWLPDVDLRSSNLGLSIQLDKLTLDTNALADIAERIPQLFADSLGSLNRLPPGKAGIEALVKYLAPNWKIEVTLSAQLLQEEGEITEATKGQYRVITLLEKVPRALISGCAGSGKTLLALEKARRLAETGSCVLVLCFNKNLATWMRSCMAHCDSVDVFHFHGLCAHFCMETDLPVPQPDPKSGDGFFRYELPEALMDALEATDKRYDALIVDEGQDFLTTWWIPIQELLVVPEDDTFYIFFDDNQRIYNRDQEFPLSTPLFPLTENCRNTKAIHQAVMAFYHNEYNPKALGPDGRKPEMIKVSGSSEVLHALRRVLKRLVHEEDVVPEDIVVLSPISKDNSILKEGHRIGHLTLSWQDYGGHKIRCSTIHAFKGLESPIVVMVEVNTAYAGTRDELLYVALSRARNHLVLVIPEGDDLLQVIDDV